MTVTFYDADGRRITTFRGHDAVPREGDEVRYNEIPCSVLYVSWGVTPGKVEANVHLNKTLDTLTS